MIPWKTLTTTYSFSDEWVSLRSDEVLLPNGTVLQPFHTLEIPDVVNVVALTDAHELILVEQYRHAVRRTLLEIPAGAMGPDETPEASARRELNEETGFGGGSWHYLGATMTMASRLSNQGHSFMALNVVRQSNPSPDKGEIIRIHQIPWTKVFASIGSGQPLIVEANQLAALFLAQQFAAAHPDLRPGLSSAK